MSGGPEITLIAVGDISLGDNAICVGHGVRTRFQQVAQREPLYPFAHVSPLLAGGDVVFGNLETVLSDIGLAEGHLSSLEMRGHPSAASRLASVFSVVNVANNHILQHGRDAFDETVEGLQRHGLAVVGLARPDRRGAVCQTLAVKGLRIAFLGYAFEPDRYFDGIPLYAFGPSADIEADVRAARETADLVVCSVHWGDEFVRYPSRDEVELGHRIIDAGAHVVLGHHPHVIRGIEHYKSGVIAYSLGNFVFDMIWNEHLRRSMVLTITLTRDGVSSVTPQFVWIGDDYQPKPAVGEELGRAANAWQDVVNWVGTPTGADGYLRDRAEAARLNRYQRWRYFSRHIIDRPVWITAQMLVRSAQRKARAFGAA